VVRKGAQALEFYSPETKQWRQAHMQARFGILNVLLAAGGGLVKLEIGTDDLLVGVDRSKIKSVGVPAIGSFLLKLQVFKSTADVEATKKLYAECTDVADRWLPVRKIVLAKKKPRPMFVQAQTLLNDDQVTLREFPVSPDGLVDSFVARFQGHRAVF